MPLIRVERVYDLVPVSQNMIADPCSLTCTRPPDALWGADWTFCPYCGEKAVVESQRYKLKSEVGEAIKDGLCKALKPVPEPVTEPLVIPDKALPERAKGNIIKAAPAPKKADAAKVPDEKVPHYSFETMPKASTEPAPKKPKGGKHGR